MTKPILRIVAQILGVTLFSAACCYIAGLVNYKGFYNSIWGLLVPAVIAILCNRQKSTQIIMAVALMVISFIVCGVAGVFFGFYRNIGRTM